MTKQNVNRTVSALARSNMHIDVAQNLLTRTLQDQAEARAAYLAKRPPVLQED
jgi:hypothetical protein